MTHTDKDYPKTVDQAVERLLSDITLNNELQISMMNEDDVLNLHLSFGGYIRNSFGLWSGNQELMESCRSCSGNRDLHVDYASMIIIRALWQRLRKENVLSES